MARLLSRLLLAVALVSPAAGCARKDDGSGDAARSSSRKGGSVRDPRYAAVMAELGRAYLLLERYELAGPLYEELVAIDGERGGDPARLVTSLGDLALVHKAQGRASEAAALYEQALALAERTFGPDHPETARALTNLAVLRFEAGAPEQARPLQERALAGAERSLGPDHPRVASLRRNLELMVAAAGPQAGGAAPVRTAAVAKVLGPPEPKPRRRPVEVANAEHEGTRLLVARTAAAPPPAQSPAADAAPRRRPPVVAPKPTAPPEASLGTVTMARLSPPAAPSSARRPGPGGSRFAIHVTSLRDPAELPGEWRRLKVQYPTLASLQLQPPQALATDEGILYPIAGGPFTAVASAEAACERLRQQGQGCRVVSR